MCFPKVKRRMKKYILKFTVQISVFFLTFLLMAGCNSQQKKETLDTEKDNSLSQAEISEGWQLLFDGATFNGWIGLGRQVVPEGQWQIEDGAIRNVGFGKVKSTADGQPAAGGDLMTEQTFNNFELYFEWKVLKAGNSGIKYNVSEELSMQHEPKYSALGFEFQLLDDHDEKYKEKLDSVHISGSLYDLIAAGNTILKPVGEYNSSKIIINGNHAEHWLNGVKVVAYEFGSARLDSLYQRSKYKDYPNFHVKKKGHIVLQNHSDDAWFKNIKIKEL